MQKILLSSVIHLFKHMYIYIIYKFIRMKEMNKKLTFNVKKYLKKKNGM